MKVDVLVDNNTLIDQYYLAEPGFSILIEDNDTIPLYTSMRSWEDNLGNNFYGPLSEITNTAEQILDRAGRGELSSSFLTVIGVAP